MRRLVDDKGELDDGELDRALWNPVVAGGTDADRAPMSIALIVVRRRRNDPVDQAVRRRRAEARPPPTAIEPWAASTATWEMRFTARTRLRPTRSVVRSHADEERERE